MQLTRGSPEKFEFRNLVALSNPSRGILRASSVNTDLI